MTHAQTKLNPKTALPNCQINLKLLHHLPLKGNTPLLPIIELNSSFHNKNL